MLLGLPVLHHMVNRFHPIKNEDENQKHTVEKCRQKIDPSVPEVIVSVMLSMSALKIHAVILLFLLTLIPYINGSGRKCQSNNQNAKIEKVSEHMNILV